MIATFNAPSATIKRSGAPRELRSVKAPKSSMASAKHSGTQSISQSTDDSVRPCLRSMARSPRFLEIALRTVARQSEQDKKREVCLDGTLIIVTRERTITSFLESRSSCLVSSLCANSFATRLFVSQRLVKSDINIRRSPLLYQISTGHFNSLENN